jgi:hypothetical protein
MLKFKSEHESQAFFRGMMGVFAQAAATGELGAAIAPLVAPLLSKEGARLKKPRLGATVERPVKRDVEGVVRARIFKSQAEVVRTGVDEVLRRLGKK